MALGATVVWEMRTTGSNDNGGGYNSGGTDYSQQDAAQLSLTDLAMTTGGTTLTSATGGFTDAMVGSLIKIASGTNFTVGWYEIASRTDTNTVELDRDATDGTDGSSGNGKVGGCLALPTDAVADAQIAGHKIHVKEGTYTFTGSITTANDGTSTSPMVLEGYKTTRGDRPTGDDRPLFAQGGSIYEFGRDTRVSNIRATGTYKYGVWSSDRSVNIFNCKITHGDTDITKHCFYASSYNFYVWFCEGDGGGYASAFRFSSGGSAAFCYAHDGQNGFGIQDGIGSLVNCVADTCVYGIVGNNQGVNGGPIINNTIYNCTTGVHQDAAQYYVFVNNIITGCTTGFTCNTKTDLPVIDFNCWYDNTTDITTQVKGPNAVNADPDLTDPANGDFSLGASSNAKNAGADYSTYSSAT